MTFELLQQTWRIYRFVSSHPMSVKTRKQALLRTLRWQLGSRLLPHAVIVDWVDGARLIARRGRAGATGNVYVGLHEHEEMAFLLHFLREGELFVDIGANIGSYSVLASAVCRAKVVCFEPSPSTFSELIDNVKINRTEALCEALNMALGEDDGTLCFTADLDSENHVLSSAESQQQSTVDVPVRRLDDVLAGRSPTLVKLDVEGYESVVLKGSAAALRSARALIIELNGSGARYGARDEDIAALLASYGFVACTYRAAQRDLRPAIELNKHGNVIFVKDFAEAAEKLRTAKTRMVFGQHI